MVRFLSGLLLSSLMLACSPTPDTPRQASTSPAAATTNAQSAALPANAVARIGDRVITEADIDREFLRMPERVRKLKDQPAMRKNLLNNMITRITLEAEARRQGIVDDPEIQARIRQVTSTIIIQALNQRMRKQQKPTEQELRSYYEKHQANYRLPGTWRVRHILLDREADAKAVIKRLQQGEDFAALAKELSKDTSSRDRGGELPALRQGQMGPAFDQALMALDAAHPISGVVHSRMGYHVIQWLSTQPARVRTFEEVRPQLTMQLQQQRFRQWVEHTRAVAKVEILKPAYRLPDVRSPAHAPDQAM